MVRAKKQTTAKSSERSEELRTNHPLVSGPWSVRVAPWALRRALLAALKVALSAKEGADNERPNFVGVAYRYVDASRLEVAATDGHMAVRILLRCEAPSGDPERR